MDHLDLHQQGIPQKSAQGCWKRAKCQINDDGHINQNNFLGKRFSSFGVTLLLSVLMLMGWTVPSFSQVAKNYQHWADVTVANWNGDILNAQKSDYFEGEVIPHVHVIQGTNRKPLVTGQSYTFTIIYNFYQRNTNAGGFAFVTTYNRSRQPVLLPGASGVAPVLDNTATAGLNVGGTQGFFYRSSNADVTAATAPVKSGGGTFDNTITVTFTYTGTDPQGLVEFYYGLYIAEPGQVPNQGSGVTDGASAWSGGSLQTTVNSDFSGALSIQLAPSAIIRGAISGLKYNDANNNGSRQSGEGLLSGWIFYLDVDNDGILDSGERRDTTDANGVFSFSVTPDADKSDADNDPYYVRESMTSAQVTAGWALTEPASGVYGPILITALDPNETGLIFGNFVCVNPLAAGTPTNVLCNGGTTGSATISATGGTSPYTFSDDGTDYSNTTGVFGTLAAGTYTFYAKDANGCIDDVEVRITEPGILEASEDNDPVSCNGASTGSATISASGGTSPYTFSDDGTDYSNTTGVFGNLAAGSYTFYAKDANGCIDEVAVSITEPDPLTATADATTVCTNGVLTVSLSITPSGGTGPYTITPVANDPYSFTVTDANGCGCVVSNAIKTETTLKSTLSSPTTISSTSPLKTEVLAKNVDSDFDKLAIRVFPNPFSEEVNFIFQSPASGYAKLEIFDLMGKRMGVVFKGNVEANAPQTARFNVPAYSVRNMLVYRLTVGDQAVSGKVLPQ